jgi:hypothetical protein
MALDGRGSACNVVEKTSSINVDIKYLMSPINVSHCCFILHRYVQFNAGMTSEMIVSEIKNATAIDGGLCAFMLEGLVVRIRL